MSLIAAWILLPALLALASLGCGLLVDRLAAARGARAALPGVLLAPVGFAAVIVLARAAVATDATAELATPLVAIAAAAGLWLGRGRLALAGIDRFALCAALAVFGVYAAPVVLGGSATFAGYGVLGDTAVHFVLIDQLMSGGVNLTEARSSFDETLRAYFGAGYPVGAHAALGSVRPLAFVDVAWGFQPFLAFIGSMLALTLTGLLAPVVASRWRRAGAGALAAMPAIVYGYSLQGSVKELATLLLVPVLAALVPPLGAIARLGPRDLIPLTVAAAAAVAVIGIAALPWLGPVSLVAAIVVLSRRPRPARFALLAASFALGLLVLSVPTLTDLGKYLDITKTVVTAQQELGNLLGPLDLLQVVGIWLNGDYRLAPDTGRELKLTYMAIGAAVLSAAVGAVWLAGRRALGPLLYLGTSLLALWYVTRSGSPWADSKAIAIAAPAVLLAAATGPIALADAGSRLVGAGLAAVLVAGVLASNALAYHVVSVAPRDRLEELDEAGERAGRGPVLYTEFEEFAKHFLRDSRPVGATEALAVPLLSPDTAAGGRPAFAAAGDLAGLEQAQLERFRRLVLRRSPDQAPPPASFERAWSGRFYELWRRRPGGRVLRHVSLEGASAAAACARLRDLAAAARRRGAALAAAPQVSQTRFLPGKRRLPAGWSPEGEGAQVVRTVGPGVVSGPITVRRGGAQELWLHGSFGRPVSVRIDGRDAGVAEDQLSTPAGWVLIGGLQLAPGRHRVELERGGGTLAPGNGDGRRSLGPLVLRPRERPPDRVIVDPARWRRLCRPLRWAEIVTGA